MDNNGKNVKISHIAKYEGHPIKNETFAIAQ